MNTIEENLQKQNVIAYNRPLRDQLKMVHEMLGIEITDVANEAIEFRDKFRVDAEKMLRIMSKLAADLSILLIEAKATKRRLGSSEQNDFDAIKSLTGTLGNLQFKLNNLIHMSMESKKLSIDISKASLEFAENIMQAQQQFREVRAGINSLGFLSNNPELAYMFDNEK